MYRKLKKAMGLMTKREKRLLLPILLMMLIGGVLESLGISLIIPLVAGIMALSGGERMSFSFPFLERLAGNDSNLLVTGLIVVLIAVFILKNLYLLFEYYIQYDYTAKIQYRLSNELFQYYITRPYTSFLTYQTNEVMQIINSDTNMTASLISNILQYYTELIVGLTMTLVVFLINARITIVLAVVLLVEYVFVIKIINPFLKNESRRFREGNSQVNRIIIQMINGIKSIKVSNAEEYFSDAYKKRSGDIVGANRNQKAFIQAPKLFIEAGTVAVMLVYVLIILHSGESVAGIVPVLSAFVLAAVRILPSVNRISQAMTQAGFSEISVDKVLKVYSEMDFKACEIRNTDSRMKFEERIDFHNISYRYPSGERQIFDGAGFSIEKGQSVGIVGPSGAGKTTCIDLVLGLLEPDGGRILVDGTDIRENMEGWYNILSYIPQQIFLMKGTLRENVAFAEGESAGDEKIWQALEDAQLADFAKSLPEGLSADIGESGIRLSGGQRQRVGVARALYRNPEILIFDEATSSLDNETEKSLMEAVDSLKGKKTMIIIAHRLSTIENCDAVYRVEDGIISRVR